jgi:hypothetical protein
MTLLLCKNIFIKNAFFKTFDKIVTSKLLNKKISFQDFFHLFIRCTVGGHRIVGDLEQTLNSQATKQCAESTKQYADATRRYPETMVR